MKRSLLPPLAVVALSFACWPVIGHSQTAHSTEVKVPAQDCVRTKSPEAMLTRLDDAVSLTAGQKIKATGIFVQQFADLQALAAEDHSTTAKELDQRLKAVKIRTAARSQVRALLTPEQQNKYDRTTQIQGGGQTMNASNRVARLDAEVVLTAEQKPIANAIYEEEAEELLIFTAEERPVKGRAARQACKELIRSLLTAEQRAKQEALQRADAAQVAEEKAFVERVLRSSNAIAMRVGKITSLSLPRSTVAELNGKLRKGSHTFNVTGTNRSETFVVHWERAMAKTDFKVIKIEDGTGQIIQP